MLASESTPGRRDRRAISLDFIFKETICELFVKISTKNLNCHAVSVEAVESTPAQKLDFTNTVREDVRKGVAMLRLAALMCWPITALLAQWLTAAIQLVISALPFQNLSISRMADGRVRGISPAPAGGKGVR